MNSKVSAVKRLSPYLFGKYRKQTILVIVFVLLNCLASMASTFFVSILIDKFIEPNLGNVNYDFTPLIKALCIFAGIYMVGVLSGLAYKMLMIKVCQGT